MDSEHGQGAARARGQKVTFADGNSETLVFDLNAQVFLEDEFQLSFNEIFVRLNDDYCARDMIRVIQAGLLYKLPDLTFDEARKMPFAIDLKARLSVLRAMNNATVSEEKIKEIADRIQDVDIKKHLDEALTSRAEGRPTGSSDGETGNEKPTIAAESTPESSGG